MFESFLMLVELTQDRAHVQVRVRETLRVFHFNLNFQSFLKILLGCSEFIRSPIVAGHIIVGYSLEGKALSAEHLRLLQKI